MGWCLGQCAWLFRIDLWSCVLLVARLALAYDASDLQVALAPAQRQALGIGRPMKPIEFQHSQYQLLMLMMLMMLMACTTMPMAPRVLPGAATDSLTELEIHRHHLLHTSQSCHRSLMTMSIGLLLVRATTPEALPEAAVVRHLLHHLPGQWAAAAPAKPSSRGASQPGDDVHQARTHARSGAQPLRT